MELPNTFVIARLVQLCTFACLSAEMVSAVSPDCEIPITSPLHWWGEIFEFRCEVKPYRDRAGIFEEILEDKSGIV